MGNGARTINETLHELLREHGEDLLCDLQRLESFLRDLHPKEAQKCFILIEIARTSILDKIRQAGFQQEHNQEQLVQLLKSKCGISPKFGQECITIWTNALPHTFFHSNTMPTFIEQSETKVQTIEEYLGTAAQEALQFSRSFGE